MFAPHGFLTTDVIAQIMANVPAIEGGLDMSLRTANWVMQADASFLPTALPNPGPGNVNAATPGGIAWPTLVFEVNIYF
jgi:hypothetical protein